jgi:hypothetical protein
MNKELWFDIKMMFWGYVGVLILSVLMWKGIIT